MSICCIVSACIAWYNRFSLSITNTYRVRILEAILVSYLEDNKDWPKNWNDLNDFRMTNESRFGTLGNLSYTRKFIDVDFEFDPATYDCSAPWSDTKPPLTVIRTKDASYDGHTGNPNETIYLHLQRIAKEVSGIVDDE